jgi:hypothetical protein
VGTQAEASLFTVDRRAETLSDDAINAESSASLNDAIL